MERFLPSVISNCPDWAEIFIADNGSFDGAEQLLKLHFPAIRYIQLEKNFGYAGGYNRALDKIEASYYILLNSDIEVTPYWVEPVINYMEIHDDVAACQPKIRWFTHPEKFEYAGAAGGYIDQFGYPFCRGRIFEHIETDRGQYDDFVDVFWATGACMFVKAKDFKEAGGFDDDFFAHMEEIDLCWRLKRMGKRVVYCPESIIYHVGGGTLPKKNPRKTFLNFRNNLLLLAKNLPARQFYLVLAVRAILDTLAAMKFFAEGKRADTLAVMKAFFSVLKIWRKKRKAGKALPFINATKVYRGSIVADYYILKKKRFSELKAKRFRT